MRRIIVTCAAAAALTYVLLSTAGVERAHAQSKKAAKAAPAPAYGNADAITEEELKVYDYFLASDQLEGRYFPSRGYDTAALYVASHLAEWGLKPGGSTSGTNGPLQPYFMPIEMVAREIVPEDSKATLVAPQPPARGGRGGFGGPPTDGAASGGRRGGRAAEPVTTTFEYGKDWTFGAGGGRGGGVPDGLDVSGNLVFAGNGYVITKSGDDPYKGIDVKGKIVVVAGLPEEVAKAQAAGRGGRGGAGTSDPLGEACKDYWTPEQYAYKSGALAVATVANFQTATAMAYPNSGGRGGRGGFGGAGLNGPPFSPEKFHATPACPAAPNVTLGMEFTNSLFQGEKVSGAQAFSATETNARLDAFEFHSVKKLTVHLAVHSQPGHAENVIGILEGSDPVLKDEYVIMSAHLDHIGLSAPMANGHNVNNGADDDGSGSTGLLGVAHAYAEGAAKGIRPKRSILFLWNGGEERGLWGSQYFTEFPPIDLSKVVADLNMDMIGRTKNANSVDPNPQHYLVDPGGVLLIGPNISSDDLESTIETVNNGFQKLKIDHFYDVTAPDATHDNLGPQPRGQRIFYRSDHYNFAKMGVPIAFFTIGLHVDYHRPTDTPEKIDYHEIQIISKTVAAVGWHLATEPGRPKLNAKLPDDLLKDMKTAKDQGWGKITPVLSPLPGEPY
ncbi:MAG TPA: M28 family peptidase [Bryobacteraceae bacterium]|nr:M28 family peptidase [Bryobacteraceae bacterium]